MRRLDRRRLVMALLAGCAGEQSAERRRRRHRHGRPLDAVGAECAVLRHEFRGARRCKARSAGRRLPGQVLHEPALAARQAAHDQRRRTSRWRSSIRRRPFHGQSTAGVPVTLRANRQESMAEYQLYCFAQSGNAYRAALMLNLIGADWEPVWSISSATAPQRTPEYREDDQRDGRSAGAGARQEEAHPIGRDPDLSCAT